ncbi:MAG: chromosome segregation protein SMC [Pseudomonadota bacterium]
MRITRLRLSGFKSFVEPTELRIETGLTGVVGPNGCGKSNLLEAIRWVMGESSPKSMRGGGMDDVIFAGTETRPSRDFAEVTLVCETSGATLPGLVPDNDGDALEVVRRIERGAGSAYRANGQDVRAKDVALIFADAATGAHSPALVSQGKVASIIAAKPQERRILLEEAAGISGLHVRRKDAEQKLRATEANLSRIGDMLADMDARAGALRRQAKAAERYTRLSDQIRIAEARMIFARWRDAASAADTARAEAAAAGIAVDAAGAQQQAAAEAQALGASALAAARDEAGLAREGDHARSAQLASLRAERQSLMQRIADLHQEGERIARDSAAEDALAREGAAAIEGLDEAARQAARQIAARERDRPGLEAQQSSAADLLRDADVALAQARAEGANESAERRIAEAAMAEAQRRLERIDGELARLACEADAAGDGEALAAEAEQHRLAAAAAVAAIHGAEAQLAQAGLARSAARQASEESEAALTEARAALVALESEAAALDRSLAASTGADPQLLDTVRAAPGYEAALAAALADDLTAPLLDTASTGGRGWRGAAALADDPALPAGVEPLANHVTAPAAIARRLAQIGVADSDDGQPLAVGQRLVTRGGQMRRWDGFVASGDGAAAAERLARANRRAALGAQCLRVRAGLDQIIGRHDGASDAASSAEAALASARIALATIEDAARTARRAADQSDAALERFVTTAAHISERRGAAAGERVDAAAAHAQAAERLTALPDGAAMAALLAMRDSAAGGARTTLNALRDGLGDLDRDVARLREAQIEAQAEGRGWRARAGEAARRITVMNGRIAEITKEQQIFSGKPDALDAAISQNEADAKLDALRLERSLLAEREAASAMTKFESRLETARETLSAAREARAGVAARAESAEARRIEMGRISGERFACPPPLLPESAGFDGDAIGNPQEESATHDRFSQDRERIGPVNLVAAQELTEIEGELASATAEADELQQAVHRLRGSIGHLNREGRTRLAAAFEQVDGHFQRLFSTLFGGGRAHLALVDSDDPLEAGLEIMVQPPGKKLSTLTLLSGGEQALTAIALIFALFLTNPAPICVLDEVDAPLDDANVERFCDLLDAMVSETATRYLIVTHNAVTMARMHRLFGVTMVERGVSRLVSVDLGSAEQLVAAE